MASTLGVSTLLLALTLTLTSTIHAIETTLASTITVTVAASTSALSSSYTSASDLQSSVLNSTNFYRYEHNATYLTWNTSLATYASSWGNKCVWEHSHGPYGENLARGYPDITAAVDAWGDERSLYDFSASDPTGFSEATGHFTQLVWKSTRSTGCAAVNCDGRNGLSGVLVVCEYYPAGNVVGEDNLWFKQNVQSQVNSGQGFNYTQATAGVGGSSATTTSALRSGTASASQPGNTMGGAPGLVVGAGGAKGWWAFGAGVAALVLAGGMI